MKKAIVAFAFCLAAAWARSAFADPQREGNWFLNDEKDAITNERSVVFGVAGKGGGLMFQCNNLGKRNP